MLCSAYVFVYVCVTKSRASCFMGRYQIWVQFQGLRWFKGWQIGIIDRSFSSSSRTILREANMIFKFIKSNQIHFCFGLHTNWYLFCTKVPKYGVIKECNNETIHILLECLFVTFFSKKGAYASSFLSALLRCYSHIYLHQVIEYLRMRHKTTMITIQCIEISRASSFLSVAYCGVFVQCIVSIWRQ